MKRLLLILALFTSLISCNEKNRKTTKIHEYHVRSPQGNSSNDMLFCYLILSSNNNYYYYSSSSSVSDFSSIRWQIMEEVPELLANLSEVAIIEEPQEELEGIEPAEAETSEAAESEGSESSGDSDASSDSGGDSGGSDGGGDGGGGGD